jgi:hypothetical protein
MRIFEGPVDKIVQLIGMQLEQAENTDKVKIKVRCLKPDKN